MKSKTLIATLIMTLVLAFTGVSITHAMTCSMIVDSEGCCATSCDMEEVIAAKLPSCCVEQTTFYKVDSQASLKEQRTVPQLLVAEVLPVSFSQYFEQPLIASSLDRSDSIPPELLIVQSTVLRI